jgi:excisionase family DNA binding protein
MSRKPQSPSLPAVEPLLISVKQASSLLSVSTAEIRILCRKGLLAYRRLGQTKWLIRMSSVRQFAEGGVK